MSAEAPGALASRRGLFDWLAPAIQPTIALVISAIVGRLLVLAMGQDPLQIYGVLISGSLVGVPNLMVTLQMTTPLLFTGLAVSIAFRAGLWNIGVEGQLLVGAFFVGLVGWLAPLPTFLHVPLTLIAAMAGGALWAAIPTLLRVKLNVNELVVCLMLNPIALLLTGFFAIHVFKAPGPTNKLPDVLETAIARTPHATAPLSRAQSATSENQLCNPWLARSLSSIRALRQLASEDGISSRTKPPRGSKSRSQGFRSSAWRACA